MSDLLVSLCWKSDSSSCDHDRSFIASHVVIVLLSVVIVIVFGRHGRRTPGGSRPVPPLPLLHVRLVQAPAAGVGVLLAPRCRRHGGLEHRLADVAGLLRASVLEGRLHHPRGDVVRLVVAGGGDPPAQAEAAFHRLEQLADDGAVGRDLHLHAPVALEVDDGEGLAGFVEDVLGDVEGPLVAFGAETAAFAVDFVGVDAGGAVRGVAGEGFHDV